MSDGELRIYIFMIVVWCIQSWNNARTKSKLNEIINKLEEKIK